MTSPTVDTYRGLDGLDYKSMDDWLEQAALYLIELGKDKFLSKYGKDMNKEHLDAVLIKKNRILDPKDRPRTTVTPTQASREMKYPDGNPKTQFGITKPRDTYTPPIPYLEYSLAHLQGALKYGPFNWRDDPVTMSTYLDAAVSHINKFRAGLDRASDTNIHELGHAMTCLSIIIDAQAHGTIKDDRWKPRNPDAHKWGDNPGKVLDDYIEQNQERVKAIREKWTNFADRFKRGEVDKNGNPLDTVAEENK